MLLLKGCEAFFIDLMYASIEIGDDFMNTFLKRFVQIIFFLAISWLYFHIIQWTISFLFPASSLSLDNILGLVCIIIYITLVVPITLIITYKISIQ